MYPKLQAYIQQQVLPAVSDISYDRRVLLDEVVDGIKQYLTPGNTTKLVFICTHNSRRSQLAQVWAWAAAQFYGLEGVECFSGGTEVTAFHANAIQALTDVGFQVTTQSEGPNPHYMVGLDDGVELECYSKQFEDNTNPSRDFFALMTCSDAEANCPVIFGANHKVGLKYEDPKIWDSSLLAVKHYSDRSLQIASELFYVLANLRNNE